jgi:hypothetical protein
MKYSTVLLFLLFGVLFNTTNAGTSGWNTFICPNSAGHFSVSFPNGGEINGMNSQDFEDRFKDKNGTFSYWYIVSFEDSNVADTPELIFKNKLDSISENYHPDKIYHKIAKFQGHPCCEYDYFCIDSPLGAERVIQRLIVVGKRIYTIKFQKFAFAHSQEEMSFRSLKAKEYPNAVKFLNSLRINIH